MRSAPDEVLSLVEFALVEDEGNGALEPVELGKALELAPVPFKRMALRCLQTVPSEPSH